MALCKRYKQNSTLVMVDIDRFRLINETYDHEVAEEVLHQMARTLVLNVREVDYVARWTGEEFIILIPRSPLYGGYKLSKCI